MIKPWEKRWSILRPLDEGGQGHTFLVAEKGTNTQAVLKRLKNADSAQRRNRFRREVVSLETLAPYSGIANLIDDNSDDFRDFGVPLYLVTELIDGPTFFTSVQNGRYSPFEALTCGRRLVQTISYAHERDVLHRDIKPDNIIMRNGDKSDPILIDFGLSFNGPDDNMETGSEQLGNRFLTLPELVHPEGEKRSAVSDITQAIGIILYSLTGSAPAVLEDENGSLPHQRPAAKPIIPQTRELLHLFDRGFQPYTARRWQSCAAALSQIERAMDSLLGNKSQAMEWDFRSFINDLHQSPTYKSGSERSNSLRAVHDSLIRAKQEFQASIGAGFDDVQTGYDLDAIVGEYRNTIGFKSQVVRGIGTPMVRWTAQITGSEIVVNATWDGGAEEVLREPVLGFEDWGRISTSAVKLYERLLIGT